MSEKSRLAASERELAHNVGTSVLTAAIVIPLIILGVFTLGAVKKSSESFTETGILQSSFSAFISLKGPSGCILFGEFDTATVTIWTEIRGTNASTPPGNCKISGGSVVCPVSVAGLIGVISSTDWIPMDMGFGGYRAEVTGGGASTNLTWHCRRSGG